MISDDSFVHLDRHDISALFRIARLREIYRDALRQCDADLAEAVRLDPAVLLDALAVQSDYDAACFGYRPIDLMAIAAAAQAPGSEGEPVKQPEGEASR